MLCGLAVYLAGLLTSIVRLILPFGPGLRRVAEALVWYSGMPTVAGGLLMALDLAMALPHKRRVGRGVDIDGEPVTGITVALTAYDDENSIGDVVRDFLRHPLVRRVIVVSNNSRDRTMARAVESGAIVHNEPLQGYGRCVFRCLSEAVRYVDTAHIVLCEGDRTFRAQDVDKLVAYMPHAQIVNGTRIVEQLREYDTQLGTFMYYGNFFVGKLLEAKHLGQGTFTDVGTTYKMASRQALLLLLPKLDPRVNLEFNAHFLDTALRCHMRVVECPITFHPRVGKSKGGNVDNLHALRVGLRMMIGLSLGWRWVL